MMKSEMAVNSQCLTMDMREWKERDTNDCDQLWTSVCVLYAYYFFLSLVFNVIIIYLQQKFV